MNHNKSKPILRMPFPAGAVMFLVQGNMTKPPVSHSNGNCLHALDFAGIEKSIVATADGEVVKQVIGNTYPARSKEAAK